MKQEPDKFEETIPTVPPGEVGELDESHSDEVMFIRDQERFDQGNLILERYEVKAVLGRGGMGVVYRCYDRIAGIEVALKSLPPELANEDVRMEDVRENFQLVERLHHPNIAAIKNLEQDVTSGCYYLIMELVDGCNLKEYRMSKGGKVTLQEALPIIHEIVSALNYAHAAKIIHRDIKPSNIMLDQNHHVKILDFGLAAKLHQTMATTENVCTGTGGTACYMAPEQWMGKHQSTATDQYALAVMVYELLNGELPFQSHNMAVLREVVLHQPPDPVPSLTSRTWKALLKAMDKDRKKRFNSCKAFADALEKGLHHAARQRKFRRRLMRLTLLLMLTLAACGFALFAQTWLWLQQQSPIWSRQAIHGLARLLHFPQRAATHPIKTPPEQTQNAHTETTEPDTRPDPNHDEKADPGQSGQPAEKTDSPEALEIGSYTEEKTAFNETLDKADRQFLSIYGGDRWKELLGLAREAMTDKADTPEGARCFKQARDKIPAAIKEAEQRKAAHEERKRKRRGDT